MKQFHRTGGKLRGAIMGLSACALAVAMMAAPAAAQQSKAPAAPAAKQPAPAAAAQGDQKPQSPWVKICDKVQIPKVGPDGKQTGVEEKQACLTTHERVDVSGMIIVSAALRELEGNPKQYFLVMVPLGVALQAGMRAAVLNQQQWDDVTNQKKIDEKALKWIDMQFALCHPQGCTAEVEATKDLVETLKTNGGLMVFAKNGNTGESIPFPVPLEGFAATYSGPPMDNKAFAELRIKRDEALKQMQAELMKKYQEQQEKAKADGAKAAPAAPAKK